MTGALLPPTTITMLQSGHLTLIEEGVQALDDCVKKSSGCIQRHLQAHAAGAQETMQRHCHCTVASYQTRSGEKRSPFVALSLF